MGKLIPNIGGGGGADLDVITAGAEHILDGKVGLDKEGEPLTGTMPNNGAVAPDALGAGGSYTIPEGYHNGGGIVNVKTLAELTADGDATAAQILTGRKAYVDGNLITGTIPYLNGGTYTPATAAQTIGCAGYYMNHNITIAAIPSTYIPISSANFFKNGALGSLYTLGVTPKAPRGYWSGNTSLITEKLKTFTLESWRDTGTVAEHFPHKSPSLSSANIVDGELQIPMVYQGGYPASSGNANYTTAYATRRTIDFTSIKTLRTNMRSLYSSHQINVMFWVMNTSTNLILYYTRRITRTPGLLDIDVSSMNGHCIFGFWACEGSENQNATAAVTEISLLQ